MTDKELGKAHDSTCFDRYAATYDEVLNSTLSTTGENKDYFAAGRVLWLKQKLARRGFTPLSVLDYGCGTGSAVPFLIKEFGAKRVTGVDVSVTSVEEARALHGSANVAFVVLQDYSPDGSFDLAFTNGVFHHIVPEQRSAAARYIYESLRPGGLFAFWENNPWNPGTRYLMSRCEFDEDAIPLTVMEARRILQKSGFKVLEWSTQFYFPRALKLLRGVESVLSSLPFGGQYLMLASRPA